MIITLTGPSGCGKTSLLFRLLRLYPERICSLVSSTMRKPRESEQHGLHYYFVNRDAFRSPDMIEQVSFGGNLYGLTKQELQKADDTSKVCIAVVNVEGARWFKEHYGAVNVFLRVSPSLAIYRLNYRDGKKKALKRQKIDVESGLYDFKEHDFSLSCSHKKWERVIKQFVARANPFIEENGLPPLEFDAEQMRTLLKKKPSLIISSAEGENISTIYFPCWQNDEEHREAVYTQAHTYGLWMKDSLDELMMTGSWVCPENGVQMTYTI